jgi:SAM-dependent methyltransferase
MTKINLDNYDFLDFGCSSGGSLDYYAKIFSAKKGGLGIDKDPKKITRARRSGHDVIQCDIAKLDVEGNVRFVVMSDFLEHIPDLKTVTLIIWKAVSISKEFVFIRQPYFDADPYLFQLQLKFFWSDWEGHPNRMTTIEFHNIIKELFNKGAIKRFSFYGRKKVKSSYDSSIHSIWSPQNQHEWKKKEHPFKQLIRFECDVFKQLVVVIDINGESTQMIEDRMPDMIKLYNSSAEMMKEKNLSSIGKVALISATTFLRMRRQMLWLFRIILHRLMRIMRNINIAEHKPK